MALPGNVDNSAGIGSFVRAIEWNKVMVQDVTYLLGLGKTEQELCALLKQRWCDYEEVKSRQWQTYVDTAIETIKTSSISIADDVHNNNDDSEEHKMNVDSSDNESDDDLDLSEVTHNTLKPICGICNAQKDEIFWEVGCYTLGCHNRYHASCMIPDPFDII